MSFLVSAHRDRSFRLALHPVHLFRTGLAVSTLLLGLRAHAVQPKTPFRVGAPQPKGWLGERGFDPTNVTLSQTPARGELFFIDGAVADPKAFWLTAPVGATVVCIPAEVEAWEYMAETATAFRNLRAIHIISHGQPGAVTLNDRRYTAEDLAERSASLRMLGGALSKNGDILLYGCETAEGNDGAQLVTTLAELTGADVAGSLNPTGSRPGADWNLEISRGEIETAPLAPKDYEHVLADFSVSNLSELRTALTTAASNNEADTITITGNITAAGSGDMLSGPDGQPTFVLVNPTDGKTLTIVGGGHTLDAGHYGRALAVQAGTVDISNLTITKGLLSGNGGRGNTNLTGMSGQTVRGAGLHNAGILQLNGVAITANKAAGGGGAGHGYEFGGGGGGGGDFGGIGGGNGGSTYGVHAGITGGGG
ncbi:MAG TPA: DUF4347 domain-containing protein, partial [Opitutus sp.]|nr:DUF4347 domain-containing protein [Opitutus sp.]